MSFGPNTEARTLTWNRNPFLRTFQAFRKQTRVRHPRALMWKIFRDTVADHWRQNCAIVVIAVEAITERFAARTVHDGFGPGPFSKVEPAPTRLLCLGCDVRGAVYLYYLEGY